MFQPIGCVAGGAAMTDALSSPAAKEMAKRWIVGRVVAIDRGLGPAQRPSMLRKARRTRD
ncbi:hypothetical protein CO678_37235 [Bradyrhizobium diazoefficiens]|nr:hypothetical protein CO678_37235 [Bradyrhizobium diazoefficiens]